MAVTWAVTRRFFQGSTTFSTVRGYIKRKQVSNQQMEMTPAKFLRPWEVLELETPGFDQEQRAKTRYPVGVVAIASTFMFECHLPLKGDLEIRRKLYGASDPERCMGSLRHKW